jgi:eukaryotic-like serine/threonine-protein kinase
MLQCSDIERMARSGAKPASPDERETYFSHVESCSACRRLLETTGLGISTLADYPFGSVPVAPCEGPSTMVGLPGDSVAPAISELPSLASLASPPRSPGQVNGSGLGPTFADTDAPARDPGQDTYSTAVPNREDAYATRLESPSTIFGGAAKPRPLSGWSSDPHSTVDQADPSWPVVPGYELLAKLGEGGMGVVYKARQRRLNRLVALKMIRGDGRASEVQLNRFRIEAEAVAQLHHPNIVQIFEIGDVAGLPYFSLELLEGGGLDSKLAGTPRPAREAAELVFALCSAIEAAHEAQIIHRDLKPANVVLAADGTPKITDFGLAKRLEEEDSQTRTGDVMGSPSYMSPEQAKGQGHLVGPASDIYSLGAILYEMLTGRPPFRGTSAWDTVRQVAEVEPVSPTSLQPRVPRDLETIALKCLAKEPGRRYATAREMGEDLRRYLAGEPILARRIPFWERGLKWVRRRPATATLSAVATAAVIGTVWGLIWWDQYRKDQKQAEADRVLTLVLESREKLSEGRERFNNRDLVAAQDLFADVKEELDREPESTLSDHEIAKLRTDASGYLDRVNEGLRSRDRRVTFEKKLGRFLKLKDQVLFLDTSFDGLQQAGLERDPEASGRKALEALELFTKDEDDGSRSLVPLPAEATAIERSDVVSGSYEMLLVLAEAKAHRASVADPKVRAAQALHLLDSAPRLDPNLPMTRAYHSRRAELLELQQDEAGARQERALLAGIKPGNGFDRYLHGLELYKKGRIGEAISEFQAASEQSSEPFWPRALMAISCVRSGRPAEARIVLDECVRERPDLAWLYLLRGYTLGQLGLIGTRLDPSTGRIGAFAAFEEAPSRVEAPRDHSASSADFEAAEEDFRRSLDRLGPDDADLRYTLHLDRGFVRLWGSQLTKAAEDFEEAIRLDPSRFNAYVNLAGVRLRQEDFDGAINCLSEGLKWTPNGSSKAGVLRFRALVRERKSGLFDGLADLEAALARALWSVVPRPEGISLASGGWVEVWRTLEARERRAAIDDYATILDHGPYNQPEQVASDLADLARLFMKAGESAEASKAADQAIAANPKCLNAHRVRIDALLARGLYDQAIDSCDACIKNGSASAELYVIRGRARAKNQDLAGAIRDFDHSLDLNPAQAQVLVDRGWTHLFYGYPPYYGAPRLALDDFERAIRVDPNSAEAFCGRGNARAALDMHSLALADAAEALRLDARSPLNRVRCARIYAIAAADAMSRVRFERVAPVSPREYANRAVTLLRGAILAQPPSQRGSFYQRVILPDDAFRPIRRDARLALLLLEALPAGAERDQPKPTDPSSAEARR